MLSNAYFVAKFRFDTAENEPAKNGKIFEKCIFRKCIFENAFFETEVLGHAGPRRAEEAGQAHRCALGSGRPLGPARKEATFGSSRKAQFEGLRFQANGRQATLARAVPWKHGGFFSTGRVYLCFFIRECVAADQLARIVFKVYGERDFRGRPSSIVHKSLLARKHSRSIPSKVRKAPYQRHEC